jgi:GT2 family glycosyltransferase
MLSQLLRRSVLLVWWTVTLQLHTHARYWLRARRLRRDVPSWPSMPARPAPIDPASLRLAASGAPLVSVVIPTYGQVDFTLRCLASIAACPVAEAIEILVIDDASDDTAIPKLDAVQGIRLLRNETNLGFLRSCNKAASLAKGTFLFFLNNDTEVLANWLTPLLDIFATRPDAGAAGSMLLYPDGRLQEAGGIIWRDGSAWNFGRHEDPEKPAYTYVRRVDYCSGAALMVRRETFLALGGFDERYVPAYFEDSDLCLRLREQGLATYYQPGSRIVHHEGTSHGVDTTIGIKSHQAINRRRFVRRWAPVLAARHYPHGQAVFRARDGAMHRPVILVVDHYVPTPDRDAGSRTMLAFLDVLAGAGMAVKFWPHNQAYSPGYTETLQARGIETLHGTTRFETWIRQHGHELDHVLLSRPDVTEDVLPLIRQHSAAHVVYYGHDLHFARMERQSALTNDIRLGWAAQAMRRREAAIWRQADLSLYPSRDEADAVRAMVPEAAADHVSPYAFDRFGADRSPPDGTEVIFVGGFGHPPNIDAAIWFVEAVFPLVQAAVPGAHLSIVGSNPSAEVQALASASTSIRPNVSDEELAGIYAAARVSVVPLRAGAGVKLKVVEALREGVPLVTTSTGAQGLPGVEAIVPVTDQAAEFATAVVARLTDDALWHQASAAQIAYARRSFSTDVMARQLLGAFGIKAPLLAEV